jgi:hypothetical protein
MAASIAEVRLDTHGTVSLQIRYLPKEFMGNWRESLREAFGESPILVPILKKHSQSISKSDQTKNSVSSIHGPASGVWSRRKSNCIVVYEVGAPVCDMDGVVQANSPGYGY